MNIDQTDFIKGLKAGNKDVFGKLFDVYYEPLCRYCMRFVPDIQEAEDIVQEVFVNIWIKRYELNIDTSVKAYLYRTVTNRAINYTAHQKIRNNYREHIKSGPKSPMLHDNHFAEAELLSHYETAVAKMPEQRKKVFVMSRKEGLKYAEIAEKLSISVKTVEAHLSKALEDLRLQLRDFLPAIIIMMLQLNAFIQ